jgi:hypothetical protein
MIIICNKPGQLGNRLYVFSHFMAYAHEKGVRLLNPAFEEYSDYFKGSAGTAIATFPSTGKQGRKSNPFWYKWYSSFFRIADRLKLKNRFVSSFHLNWDEGMDLDQAPELMHQSKFCLVNGWDFRCEILFRKHFSLIHDYFSPDTSYQKSISEYIAQCRKGHDLLIGIHIRRGDYAKFEGGKFFFNDAQYLQVMQQIKALHPDKKCGFILCSNEDLDLSVFTREGLEVTAGPGHELKDMYALSSCDLIAGPPSTFSMWASQYNKVPLYMIKDVRKNIVREDFLITGY